MRMFVLALLLALASPGRAGDVNSQLAQLNLDTATLDDVVRVFGEPAKFVWGDRTFARTALPEIYLAVYPNELMFLFGRGRIMEVRHHAPGYRFRGTVQVGDSAEALFAVTGKPAHTAASGSFRSRLEDGVYYTDFADRPGAAYYSRRDLGARFFLNEGKVAAIYLLTRNSEPAARPAVAGVPRYNPDSNDPWQVDLRGKDLSGEDLRARAADLLYATFDNRTRWPEDSRMPREFDRERIFEWGRTPGLGIRQLHQRGVTGRGVALAMLDQPLLREHREYAGRLRLYEEVNSPGPQPQMHGPACLSLAAGKTVGVAPEAELYYLAVRIANPDRSLNFKHLATALRRILEVNTKLPDNGKIRVVAMQIGWSPGQEGYEEMDAAAAAARAAGMLVVCSSLDRVHGFRFHGLGRHPLADPESFDSYEPGMWWMKSFAEGRRFSDRLLVPMDSRTAAGPGAADEYVFYRQGGWSWSIPYIAGLYALAAQVDPGITPERFWSAALKTGHTVEWKHGAGPIPLGPIVNPAALIDALRKR